MRISNSRRLPESAPIPDRIVARLRGAPLETDELAARELEGSTAPRGVQMTPRQKTARVRLELARRNRQLVRARREIETSQAALQDAQVDLIESAKLESVGRLAAGVAHEVKNPLTAVLMGVEYLRKHLQDADYEVQEVLQDMDEAIKRATAVVRGLLDFSTPAALERSRIRVRSCLDNSLVLTKHEFARGRVIPTTDLDPALPPLWLDPNKIEQVFVNLFLNAIQAMPEGGSLHVRGRLCRREDIQELLSNRRLPHSDRFVIIEVEDTGPGIPPEKLLRVFDPFFTTKRAGEGTGLGLTVVQKIMEMHGGCIELQNRSEGGMRVTLVFVMEEVRHERAQESALGRRRGSHDARLEAQPRGQR